MDPNQTQPGVVPAGPIPTSPIEQPAQVPQQGGGISDQQKQELLDMITQIKSKLGSFQAVKFASDNKKEKVRLDLLKQVFEKLQLAGVDLSDQQSVSAFIEKLKQANPELANNFEQAMNVLLEGGKTGLAEVQDPNATLDLGVPPQNMNNNMNINPNENLSQTI